MDSDKPFIEAKLYSPVFGNLYGYDNVTGGFDFEIDQKTAASFYNGAKWEHSPDEPGRDLMARYATSDSANEKITAMSADLEVHGGKLWTVTTLTLTELLTPGELGEVHGFIENQYANGFGEKIMKQPFRVEDGLFAVNLWKQGEFYLDTQEQFSRRLSIDLPADALSQPVQSAPTADTPLTPAQKALDEPDASDSAEVAELRDKLFRRLDVNFADYFDSLQGRDSSMLLTDLSSEISAMARAYGYMTVMHNFHPSELSYLLQFQDPLKVVAAEFEWDAATESRSDLMWKVFHEQEALTNGKHELAPKGYIVSVTDDDRSFYIPNVTHIERDDSLNIYPDDDTAAKAAEADGVKLIYGIPFVPDGVYIDTTENRVAIAAHFEQHRLSLPAEPELVQALGDRLDANFTAYKEETLQSGKNTIFNDAAEIAAAQQAYAYFRDEHHYTTGQAEFLLKLENPLELMSDRWGDGIGGVRDVVNAVFHDQERTLRGGSYALASENTTPAGSGIRRPDAGTGEKPSVMEQIRQAAKAAAERPADPNLTPESAMGKGIKKTDPDL